MTILKPNFMAAAITGLFLCTQTADVMASAGPAAASYEFLTATETLQRQHPGEPVTLNCDVSSGVDITHEEEAAFRAAFLTFTGANPGFVQCHAAYNFDPRYEGSHLALNNFRESFGQYASQTSGMLQTWMTVNVYKNHPTLAEHSAEIVTFSRALKGAKTALNLAIANNRVIEETWYGLIKTTYSLCGLFDNMKAAFVQAQQIRRDVEALPTRAAFLADLPADPIQTYLVTDGFEMTVLDRAHAAGNRAENPLNVMNRADRPRIATEILRSIEGIDEAWKQDPRFLARILAIFEDNLD